jgi:hypothetical protein
MTLVMPSISLSKLSSRIGKKYVLKARTMKHYRHITKLVMATTLISTIGCSRQPKQLEIVGAAKMAVREAEREDYAPKLAPADLSNARAKLADAEQAASNGDELRARRMSEQAIVDAQLARAKTDSGLSRLGAVEEKDAMQDLQREVERNR